MSSEYYQYIPGKFVILGKSPDGDSIRFVPEDRAALGALYRSYLIRPSHVDGSVQLRLEGIDAPETHYGPHAQPLGDEARKHLLEAFGFLNVSFDANHKVMAADPLEVDGYIAAAAADPHGRPIAFAFKGAPPLGSVGNGQRFVSVDRQLLEQSVNIQMLTSGAAYPLIYTSMPNDLVPAFQQAAETARKGGKGVWAEDCSASFIFEGDIAVLKDDGDASGNRQLIYPKLFRRCVDYAKALQAGFSGDLQDWLRRDGAENDRVLIDNVPVPLSETLERRNRRLAFLPDIVKIRIIER